MSITRVVCPHCAHHLHTAQPVLAGQRARCPSCHRAFIVGVTPRAVAPPPQAILVAPQAILVPPQAVPVASQPAPRRPRTRLWAGIVLGGVLLLMGVSVGLVLYLGEKAPGPSPADDPGSAESELLRQDTPPAPEPPWLSEENQAKVNAAIDRGLAWLRKRQTADGSWTDSVRPLGQSFATSLAALPALTLLECGIPGDDPQVTRAARLVRDTVPGLNWTYDLALAILFLDRLQQEEDRPRIRSLILRLVAGQQANGGWNYHCPVLTKDEELALSAALEKTRPSSPLDLFQQGGKKLELGLFVKAPRAGGIVKKLEPLELTSPPGPDRPSGELSEAEREKLLGSLPQRLRAIPALRPPAAFSANVGDADNSNTQFAILALLVAERYDVTLERTLALVVHRFQATQMADGEWDYGPRKSPKPQMSMTGAGLLGLAVKYGLVLSSSRHKGQAVTIQDAAIDKGLKALGEYIGHPMLWGRPDARDGQDRVNLYGLWSVERVGALYHLRRINGKEWYSWGVDQLLEWQEPDGAWRVGQYGGTDATDTCFALLFLRRADFARDLSKKLEFFAEGKNLLGP